MSSQKTDEKVHHRPNFTDYNKEVPIPSDDLDNEDHNKKFQLLKTQVSEKLTPKFTEAAGGEEGVKNVKGFDLGDMTLLRYLRANQWKVDQAYKGLEATIDWRSSYGVDKMTPEEFKEEGATGKLYCDGFDLENHPVIYMDPSLQNTKDHSMNVKYTVFNLELAVRMLPPSATKVIIILDLRNYSYKHVTPMSKTKQVINILSSHYPERLHRAYIIDAPWLFSSFFKLVSPLLDPVTRDKARFVSLKDDIKDPSHPKNFIPANNLHKDMGGENSFKFDAQEYFAELGSFYTN